jgi:hypothetical protein
MSSSGLPSTAAILDALLHPPAPNSLSPWNPQAAIMDPIVALHRNNHEQWDREDDVRRDNADDARVAAAKRDIDRLNFARHGYIEAIDRAILCTVDPRPGTPLVTESPGVAIDRLSVLVIRLGSTEARAASGAADAELYSERLPRLQIQLNGLEDAIASLLDDLARGTRRFHIHESLKLYGPEDHRTS